MEPLQIDIDFKTQFEDKEKTVGMNFIRCHEISRVSLCYAFHRSLDFTFSIPNKIVKK